MTDEPRRELAEPPGGWDDWETDEPFDQAEGERQKPFLSTFTHDDAKLLLVTFVGTVVANIITVMTVALAVAGDRSRWFGGYGSLTNKVIGNIIFLTLFGVMLLVAIRSLRRSRGGESSTRNDRRTGVIAVVLAGLLAAWCFGDLLGLASGVK